MRLNPFVYISETDIRFYLLVLIGIIIPSLWASLFGIAIFSLIGGAGIISLFQRLLIVVPIVSFIPLLIYWNYKRYPRKIIKESELTEFDKKRYSDHFEYIGKLYGKYLSTVKRPTLMYRFTTNPLELPFTFGTKEHMYVSIPSGLIQMFRKYLFSWDNIPGNDSEKLLRFLRDDLNIGWAENAEIRKSDDSIHIIKDKNSAEITIDERKEKAILKIGDDRSHDLQVKKEKGELNIYFQKNIGGFKSIFLHEMGHIANRDVEKTYLADSTWKSLFLTLSIPLGFVLLYVIIDYIILRINPGIYGDVTIRFILYFLIFGGIIYVLRKQIIRLREFYADAKALEWEESPEEIVKTLEKFSGEFKPKIEPNLRRKWISMAKRIIPKLVEEAREKIWILTKFHPKVNERIQVLKNNSSLFVPSLWVAFAIGFFYDLIEAGSVLFKSLIFSDTFWAAVAENVGYQPLLLDIGFRALISIFIFSILMLAVSSSFHKSILKDVFIDNTKYFSTATILNAVKFSLAFSLGWVANTTILLSTFFSFYEINFVMWLLLNIPTHWILHAVYFSIALVFLIIFASMLMRRSFSKKEAKKNFLIITILSSFLYIINRFVAIEILDNMLLLIVFFLIFSVLAYIFIKIKDRRLCCPNCNNKISNLSGLKLNCPNCHHNLYSWAIYSFS